ncbi:Transcriptional activator protein DAL81 like [Verticillium longisporum]|nr:Transcriptional activator protein DAL81 like [Verticillium longisporum]
MPLPSSFASAAAGQNANRDARAGRGDGRGGAGGDWARSGGRANGTLTFRRSSTTPGQTSHSATPSDQAFPQTPLEPTTPSVAGVASYDFASQPAQYAKQSILNLFQDAATQQESSEVLEPGWTPGHANGNSSRGWGKTGHTHAIQDPNSCWLPAASNGPNSSRHLSAEEKEAFASDVNSPLKPPNQQQKEGAQQGGTNGRKTSVSHGSGGPGFGVASPTSASRPSTRRRETTDSNPFAAGGVSSPATARLNRDDSGFLFGRKGGEAKDQDLSEEEGGAPPSRGTPQGRGGFGGLLRSNTAGAPIAGTNISSLWGQSNPPPPSSGMGNFGQFALPTPTALGGSVRGGSRFANLIPGKEGAEDAGGAKQAETPGGTADRSWRSRPRTDTDPFGDDSLSGSAALGGAKDTSPPPMPNPATSNMGVFETPVKGSTGDFGMSGLNLGQHGEHDQGPVSPSETNPYRSPPAERGEDHDESDKRHGAGIGAEQPSNFSTLSRGFPAHPFADGSDRILELAKPLQLRLKAWLTALPTDLSVGDTVPRKLSSVGYLHLAYYTAEITLHRAILRSHSMASPAPDLYAITRLAASTRFTSALDFVKRLKAEHLQSFWYFSSGLSLAIIGLFAGILCMTSQDREGAEREALLAKLAEYRWLLRINSTSAEFMKYSIGVLDARSQLMEQQIPLQAVLHAAQSVRSASQLDPVEYGDGNDDSPFTDDLLLSPNDGDEVWQQQQQQPLPNAFEQHYYGFEASGQNNPILFTRVSQLDRYHSYTPRPPPGEGDKFDLEYYLGTHMEIARKAWLGLGLINYQVINFTSDAAGAESAFSLATVLTFDSADGAKSISTAAETKAVLDDVPNFTNVQPSLLFGDVREQWSKQ